MIELKSKCCGAKIYWESVEIDAWRHIDIEYCSKCKERCKVEEINKPQDTALYASLRR